MKKSNKPVLLFFPMEMPSHYLRCLQLADAVKDFVTCIFATEKYFDLITDRGYEVHFCKSHNAEMIVKMGQEGDSSWMSSKNLNPILERQYQLIKELNPNYVVNDYSFTAHLAAEKANIPCISLINGLFSKHLSVNRGIPPSHPMAKFAFLLPTFIIQSIQGLIFKILHLPFRQLRKKHGLSSHNTQFLEEFEGDINLILDTEEYAPQKFLPQNSVFLGPVYHTDSKIENQILQQLDPNKKTILVNMGSGGLVNRVQFLNNEYFKKFNIIVVGNNTESLVATHFIKKNFLSLESILPHVDLVLNQAGTGNIFQSLAHGVPVLCYPTFFEQEWNASRIAELGHGLYLTGKESFETMKVVIETWTEKKVELQFQMLKTAICVERTKKRFREVLKNIFNQQLGKNSSTLRSNKNESPITEETKEPQGSL